MASASDAGSTFICRLFSESVTTWFETDSLLSVSVLGALGVFKSSPPKCGRGVALGERHGVPNDVTDASQSRSSNGYEGQITAMSLSEEMSSASSSSSSFCFCPIRCSSAGEICGTTPLLSSFNLSWSSCSLLFRLWFSLCVLAVLSWYSETVSFTTSRTSCTTLDSSFSTRAFRRSILDILNLIQARLMSQSVVTPSLSSSDPEEHAHCLQPSH